MIMVTLPLIFLLVEWLTILPVSSSLSSSSPPRRRASLITGANGYLGREIVHTLLTHGKSSADDSIVCLVRSSRIHDETKYWNDYYDFQNNSINNNNNNNKPLLRIPRPNVKILPYDMIDGGVTLDNAIQTTLSSPTTSSSPPHLTLFHTASIFQPTTDHDQTALDNVRGTIDAVNTLSHHLATTSQQPHFILTSSMAAIRGTGQPPANGSCYTHHDWNTLSRRHVNWGQSYQWSKTTSEKQAWDRSKETGVAMTALCPSFIFGPPRSSPTSSSSSSSYSVTLVDDWINGKSAVQSRLCVDVRDAAMAHVEASFRDDVAKGKRYVVSAERRLSSRAAADILRRVVGEETAAGRIVADEDFDGGAIKIGEREVVASERLREDLGVVCRSVEETLEDMGRFLLMR